MWFIKNTYITRNMIGSRIFRQEKYHQRGVINDATYQKTKTALEKVDKLIEDEKIR